MSAQGARRLPTLLLLLCGLDGAPAARPALPLSSVTSLVQREWRIESPAHRNSYIFRVDKSDSGGPGICTGVAGISCCDAPSTRAWYVPPRPLAHPRIRTRCAALALRARAPAPVTSLHACVCGRCARRAHAAPRDPRLARLVHRHENGRSRAPVQRLPSYVYGTDAAGARAPVWCRGRSTGSVEPDACLRCAAGRSRRATWATTPTLRRGAPPPRACGPGSTAAGRLVSARAARSRPSTAA